MGSLFRILLRVPLVQPMMRPAVRFFVGLIAIPLFRVLLKRVIRMQEIDAELEKDLEQWFRASLVLLAATRNMEEYLFGWVPLNLQGEDQWIAMGFRLLLAISVVEMMPDQELFAVIHPGPPKLKFSWNWRFVHEVRSQFKAIAKGLVCQHINRSSPVFAIMAAIAPGNVGWFCYGMAIAQYLIIGLVTSRDKALDFIAEFDKQVALRRKQLIEEFDPQRQTPHSAESMRASADDVADRVGDQERTAPAAAR